jgi:phosphate acetyltransferase
MTNKRFKKYLTKTNNLLQKNILLPEFEDVRVLKAASKFINKKLGKITILGEEKEIIGKFKRLGLNYDKTRLKILNNENSNLLNVFSKTIFKLRIKKNKYLKTAKHLIKNKNYFGTMMVSHKLVDGMVSGATYTTENIIIPALQLIKKKEGINKVSYLFFMLLKTKVVIYGYCALNIKKSYKDLVDIVTSTLETSKVFGIKPKIAILSDLTCYSETGYSIERIKNSIYRIKNSIERIKNSIYRIKNSIERIKNSIYRIRKYRIRKYRIRKYRIRKYRIRKTPKKLMIEGPIQYDAAANSEIIKENIKNYILKENANIFIFTDIMSVNNTYKAVNLEKKSIAIGPLIQGLTKPINDLSIGATVEDIYHTILITSLQR